MKKIYIDFGRRFWTEENVEGFTEMEIDDSSLLLLKDGRAIIIWEESNENGLVLDTSRIQQEELLRAKQNREVERRLWVNKFVDLTLKCFDELDTEMQTQLSILQHHFNIRGEFPSDQDFQTKFTKIATWLMTKIQTGVIEPIPPRL